MYVCVCTCTYMCMDKCMYVYLYLGLSRYGYKFLGMSRLLFKCILCVCVFMHAGAMYTIYIYICVYIIQNYIYSYIYIYIYIILFVFSQPYPAMRLVMVSARRGRSLRSLVQLKCSCYGCIIYIYIYPRVFNHCLIVFVTTNKMLENMFFSLMLPILPRATNSFLPILDPNCTARLE